MGFIIQATRNTDRTPKRIQNLSPSYTHEYDRLRRNTVDYGRIVLRPIARPKINRTPKELRNNSKFELVTPARECNRNEKKFKISVGYIRIKSNRTEKELRKTYQTVVFLFGDFGGYNVRENIGHFGHITHEAKMII